VKEFEKFDEFRAQKMKSKEVCVCGSLYFDTFFFPRACVY